MALDHEEGLEADRCRGEIKISCTDWIAVDCRYPRNYHPLSALSQGLWEASEEPELSTASPGGSTGDLHLSGPTRIETSDRQIASSSGASRIPPRQRQ